jgi:hypothetical protein
VRLPVAAWKFAMMAVPVARRWERARKREELLTATEQDLARIKARAERAKQRSRGAADIGRAAGR